MVKLSIVMAYYNTYELTRKTLEEIILPQLTDETQFILVDDGCNETRFDDLKDKIDIIHLKENCGGGFACNTGIEHSKGRYIGFIDGDDSVSNDYVQALINAIDDNPTDLIYLDWQDTYTGVIITRPDNYAPWKAIYKRDIIPRFSNEIKFHFDVPFYDEIKRKGLNRSYVDKLLYFYNSKRPGNLSEVKEEMVKKGLL